MIMCKLHWTPVATLNPRPTLRRRRRLAPNGRSLDQPVQRQSCLKPLPPHAHTNTRSSRLKRARAIDPFESSSMANSSATGLADDWRTKIQSPYGTIQPRSVTLDLWTPGRGGLSRSASASAVSTPSSAVSMLSSVVSMSSSSTLSVSEPVARSTLTG